MDKYIELDSTSLDSTKQHCVFASIYCKDGKPYYKKVTNKNDSNISIVFMQMRWDGSIGFPGGKVSKEEVMESNGQVTIELLKNTLIRELQEEIDIKDNYIKKNKLKHLSSFIDDLYIIHNFSYEITYNEMIELYEQACKCSAIGKENLGNILVHIYEYSKYKGLNNFLQNKFCGCTKYELLDLIKNENLLFLQETNYELKERVYLYKNKSKPSCYKPDNSIQKMTYEFVD